MVRMAGVRHVFVAGTDTDVGKTVISAILTAGLSANYWKPVQCGLDGKSDRELVQEMTRLQDEHFYEETYRFAQPLSPHAAAEIENVVIDMGKIRLPDDSFEKTLIVEGAGGLMVPLNDTCFMIDLVKKLGMPVLLVARSTLGTINHTLLSLEALRSRGIAVLGVVMNGPCNRGNREALEKFGKIPVLAEIEKISSIHSVDFAEIYRANFPAGLFQATD